MLVLHGFWSARRGLCLWAEDSELAVKSRSQALRSARPHPFAAPAERAGGDPRRASRPRPSLLLPSLRTAPLDSPELIRITPRPPARSRPRCCRGPFPSSRSTRRRRWPPWPSAPPASVTAPPSATWPTWPRSRANSWPAAGCCPALARDQAGAAARWRPVPAGARCRRPCTSLVAGDAAGLPGRTRRR